MCIRDRLLQDGQFATNVELAEAAGYERSLLAEKFWYLYHDFSEEAREAGYLPSLANNPGRGFPEEFMAGISTMLQELVRTCLLYTSRCV